MQSNNSELYWRHISTHTERSAEDRAAVSTLETFLTSDGKINTNFSCDDKWPNHDGTFEFVSEPEISRCPEQQKGSGNLCCKHLWSFLDIFLKKLRVDF